MPIFTMTEMMYELVYDSLSFTLACMMATTIFLWFKVGSVHEKYKTALIISGLVTFIAAYHYFRIFNSWAGAYEYAPVGKMTEGGFYDVVPPHPTGVPFNDAYRYMDWLLTVPLLLLEILLVMKLDSKTLTKKGLALGLSSALMIVIGYPGEMILNQADLPKRFGFWAAALVPFIYIVYELTVGLSAALNEEEDEKIKNNIWYAQKITIVSWLTYPVVYVIPMMMGARGPGQSTVVGIQMGYCVSDIISKCGVGLVIYLITNAKSKALMAKGEAGYTATAESQPLLAGK